MAVREGSGLIPPNICVLPGIAGEDFRRVWREVWKKKWEEDGLEKPDKIKELKASEKRRLNTVCRLKPLVIFSVKLRNSFKGKYFRHLTRVLVRFPETKSMSKVTVPHFSRGENVVHSSVERI